MRIGTPELIVILIIALLIFGPQKLPQMAKTLGQTLGGFKKELTTYEEDAAEIKDALKMDTTSTTTSKKKKKKKSSTKKKVEPEPEEEDEEESAAEAEAPAEEAAEAPAEDANTEEA